MLFMSSSTRGCDLGGETLAGKIGPPMSFDRCSEFRYQTEYRLLYELKNLDLALEIPPK